MYACYTQDDYSNFDNRQVPFFEILSTMELSQLIETSQCYFSVKKMFVVLLLVSLISNQPTTNQQYAESTNQKPQQEEMPATQVLSPTEQKKIFQQQELIKYYKQSNVPDPSSSFSFEITHEYEEFHFHLATDHTIQFLIRVYVLKNNAYNIISNIEEEPAMHMIIYQNNHRNIAQKTFYFENVITVEGKKGSTYMMRFYSPTPKLVIVNHNNFIQSSYFEQKVKSEKLMDLYNKLGHHEHKMDSVFKTLKTTHWIQFEERSQLTNKFERFSKFQIIEMMMVLAICFFQTRLIFKLLRSDSII